MTTQKKTYTTENNFCEGINHNAGFVMPIDVDKKKPRLLLHSCCGPCSTAVIERLVDRYDITVFFYNPNITNIHEYELRRNTQIDFLNKFNKKRLFNDKIAFIEGVYNPDQFLNATKGLESEPEGGIRCELCFAMRLRKTAELAAAKEYDAFATTLSVSPHKNYDIITTVGIALSREYGVMYLDENFRKKAGYQRSIVMSKEYNLYRQHFCGCVFSEQK